MRFIATAALALLLVGVANAFGMNVTSPEFIQSKTHVYEVWINITSGVPGMHPQVSKSAINMEWQIFREHGDMNDNKQKVYMKFENVLVSHSVAGVGSKTAEMVMKPNPELEEALKIPTIVILKNGKVISYTLDNNESLESKKIKKSCIRHLEITMDKKALTDKNHPGFPITYNLTRTTPVGNYDSHYIITSSPYTDFPKDKNVINITRTDNYEAIPYLTYHTHHNYEEQGCPGVCKKNHVENRFSAGCPVNYEPYQTPMKKSFVRHHNLRRVKTENIFIYDKIFTKETHVADIYDQNMEVDIQSSIEFRDTSGSPIPEPTGQTEYTDLDDWAVESHAEEIDRQCKYTTEHEAFSKVIEFLRQITEVVHKGSIEGEARNVGEKIVLLQKALALLKRKDFEKIQKEHIVSDEESSGADEKGRIQRQIWLDMLALTGTPDSISFIVELIKTSINERHHGTISVLEASVLLESLPMNIMRPTSKTISELSTLPEALSDRTTPGYGIYYSASYIAVARVIRNMCAVSNGIPEGDEENKPNYLQMLLRETNDAYKNGRCPRLEAKAFIKNIETKLKSNSDRLKRIIYIEALSQTGLSSAIPILKQYVQGRIVETGSVTITPSYLDYIRSVAMNALHNLVGKHPLLIKNIVLPIFSNKTEPPKLRMAAFSVLMRSYPTLGDLQLIAEETHHEPSLEVGSYVTSTLETLGNSTIPCDQLTAGRIKKVLPQVKRFSIGHQHAKNIKRTLFDAIRGFGFDHSFEVRPSNESWIPSAMYASAGYNADSVTDKVISMALNVQGLNSINMWDNLWNATFGRRPAESIPKNKERVIFPRLYESNGLADRADEFWRFTLYHKLFYSVSYYYMDDPEFHYKDLFNLVKQHLKNYLTIDRNGDISGHLLMIWMPSTYQADSIAQTLTYPVSFQMRNPMLSSWKIDVKHQGPKYDVYVRPTYWHSMLYTNQILNLGDCKRVGVYHEKKIAATYPFHGTYSYEEGNHKLSYRFPELSKKVLTYHSEAGTFARKHVVAPISPSERKTIETMPTLFVRNSTLHPLLSPPLQCTVLTEDMSNGFEEVPRNHEEAIYRAVQDFLNAGWRRKTVDIIRKPEPGIWDAKTEVTLNVYYNRTFQRSQHQGKSDDSWIHKINFDSHDEKNAGKEEDIVHENVRKLAHILERLSITVDQNVGGKHSRKTNIHVVHKRTMEGLLHTLQVNGTLAFGGVNLTASTKFASVYLHRPNEFNYGKDGFGRQKGVILGSVYFPHCVTPSIVTKVLLGYKSLEHHLNREVQTKLPSKDFFPETHERCVNDVEKGSVHSVDCIKAINEHSIYNRIVARIVAKKELPPVVQNMLEKFELSARHALFRHMDIEKITPRDDRTVDIDMVYVDKFTDKPVVDIRVKKPSEVVTFRKVDLGPIQPISSIYSVRDTYVHAYTNNTYPATCSLNKKNIRTYDMKTIRLSSHEACSYVLSTHCVRHKKFAVIVKIDPERPTSREVTIYLGKHSIVLTPAAESKYEIKFDDKPSVVYWLQPLQLSHREGIYAVVTKPVSGSKFIEIRAERAGIKVAYNGQHVKIQVHPRYKGELCGLCSEFNGETVMEMRGPNRCLFSKVNPYLRSNALGSCYKYKGANEDAMCHINDYDHSDVKDHDETDEADRQKEYEPNVRRNRVIPKNGKLCISTEAIPVCHPRDLPLQTESKKIWLHCLSKEENNTRKLVIESKRRILGELETKEKDLEENVEYPTRCARQ